MAIIVKINYNNLNIHKDIKDKRFSTQNRCDEYFMTNNVKCKFNSLIYLLYFQLCFNHQNISELFKLSLP
jgi:hypothetical protein